MKQCPKCDAGLQPTDLGPVEVDECRECKGVWFDTDELRQAKDAADSDLNWMDFEIWKHEARFQSKPSTRECPNCQKPMVSLRYGDTEVEIDYCQSCRGTWLDRGEFEKIIESLEEELLTKSFSEYVKESVQEAREILTGPESVLSEWKDFAKVFKLMQYRLFVERPKLLESIINAQRGPFR